MTVKRYTYYVTEKGKRDEQSVGCLEYALMKVNTLKS